MGRGAPVHPFLNRNRNNMKDLFTLWMESVISTQIGRRVDIAMPQEPKATNPDKTQDDEE